MKHENFALIAILTLTPLAITSLRPPKKTFWITQKLAQRHSNITTHNHSKTTDSDAHTNNNTGSLQNSLLFMIIGCVAASLLCTVVNYRTKRENYIKLEDEK
jgi:hypothetical protein